MKEQLTQTAVPLLVNALVLVLSALFAALGRQLHALVAAKVKGEKERNAIFRIGEGVMTAVKATEQTVLRELKEAAKDGVISDEDYRNIKRVTVSNAIVSFGDLTKLVEALGLEHEVALRQYVADKVEAFVLDMKTRVFPPAAVVNVSAPNPEQIEREIKNQVSMQVDPAGV